MSIAKLVPTPWLRHYKCPFRGHITFILIKQTNLLFHNKQFSQQIKSLLRTVVNQFPTILVYTKYT